MSKQRDPAKLGVSFVLEEPLPPSAIKVSLTFTMNDTSLLNIAKHVANVAEITVEPRKDGLYVMPTKRP